MLLIPTLTACNPNSANGLTQAEAETIALEHAGFTTEEVSGLYTEYEIDDGIKKYERVKLLIGKMFCSRKKAFNNNEVCCT